MRAELKAAGSRCRIRLRQYDASLLFAAGGSRFGGQYGRFDHFRNGRLSGIGNFGIYRCWRWIAATPQREQKRRKCE